MSAFRQVVRKLQDGQREEAMIGLEFVLRLDAGFRPALNLQRQLSSGAAEIDLSSIITELQAPTTDAIESLLVEAVEDFERRNFIGAKEKVEKVLLDLPGHAEARQLLAQVTQALKVETQVGQFLAQAREALDLGDPQEAANFVMMAQALDPHHAGIEATLQEIYAASGTPMPSAAAAPISTPPSPPAEPFAGGIASGDFAVSFDEPPSPSDGPPGFASTTAFGEPATGGGPSGFDGAPPLEDFGFGPTEETPGSSGGAEDWGGFSSSDFTFGQEAAADAPGEHAFDGAEPDLFQTAGDVSDLFDAGPDVGPAVDDYSTGGSPSETSEIERALRAGDEAFEQQSFAEAIHRWSHGLLSDPENAELRNRISGARITLDDLRQQLDQTLESARAVADTGDRSRALELLAEVVAVEPGHLGAALLRERLELPSAAPVTPPTTGPSAAVPSTSLPNLEDDLFSEELGGLDGTLDEDEELLQELAQPSGRPASRAAGGRRPPWVLAAMGAVGLLVVLAGAWVGIRLLGSGESGQEADPTAVNQVLQESQTLFDQRRVEEAIQLLQNFPVTGLQRERLDRRIETYQQALTPPTPTPIPEGLIRGRELLDGGQFLAAYETVERNLGSSPRDPGLLELRERIVAVEPLARGLYSALAGRNFRAAVGAADAYLAQHPTAADGKAALERSLFNAALAELRSYNLTGAEVHLQRLLRLRPDDIEVSRILEFIDRYKASPVDMQFQTFTRSLSDR